MARSVERDLSGGEREESAAKVPLGHDAVAEHGDDAIERQQGMVFELECAAGEFRFDVAERLDAPKYERAIREGAAIEPVTVELNNIPGSVLPLAQCVIVSVEVQDDLSRVRVVGEDSE